MKHIFYILLLCASTSMFANNHNLDLLLDTHINYFDTTGFLYFKPYSLQPGVAANLYTTYTNDQLHHLVLKKRWEDPQLKMNHYRYQETYWGLKVEGAEYTEHPKDDYLIFSNRKLVHFERERSPEPTIDEETALNMILASMEEYSFPWNNADWEQDLKDDLDNPDATYFPQGELMWALSNTDKVGWNINPNRYRLAWKFDLVCLAPHFHKAFYVDAHTGNVFREQQLVCNDGPANILTQGIKTIDTRWKGGLSSGHILYTNNGRKVQTKYGGWWFSPWGLRPNIKDANDIWGNSEQMGTTAHWMVTQAWDFYANTFSRHGMDDDNAKVRVGSDVRTFGASYSPLLNRNFITFGSMSNLAYAAVIDVAGHEFTHGVDEYTAQLEYVAEPGALDESFADIFGFMVERYAEGGVADWLIAEDANAIRSLENPNDFDQPDTYLGDFWEDVTGCVSNDTNDHCWVHVNSGVQNFWFHLLADGGIGTNDNGDDYEIQPIGIDRAGMIAYWNHTNILQNLSHYSDSRSGAITAARLIYGFCSDEDMQTTNAWAAVGVGTNHSCEPLQANNLEFSQDNIAVFPNPVVHDKFSLRGTPNGQNIIKIVDAGGKIVWHKTLNNKNNQYINVQNLSNGIYQVFIHNQHFSSCKKLIISR